MVRQRPVLTWWVYLNVAVFLLWFHFAVRDAKVITTFLTAGSGQVTLAVSLLLTAWAIYFAVVAGLVQRNAGQRLFHLELKWKRFFVLAGFFLAASAVASVFVSQVTMDPVSMVSDVVKIAAALYAGGIGLADTGITEKGLATPFALIPWPDVESYDWLDGRHIVFRATARIAGFRYKMRPALGVPPAQRQSLAAFLAQRINPQS